MRYFTILTCFLVGLHTVVFAQVSKDSLRRLVATYPPTDTLHIYAKIELANELRYDAPDTSLLYASSALAMAQKLNFSKATGRASRVIGVYYRNKGNHDEALKFFRLSEQFSSQSGDIKGLAFTYNSIAAIYKNQANAPMAIEYCQKALREFDVLKDKKGAAYVLNNMADIYVEQGDYDKALQYANTSLRYSEENKDNKGIFYSNFNISEIYKLQTQYEKALEYQLKNILVAEKVQDKSDIIYACNQIGSSYMALDNYKEAFPYLRRALILSKEINNINRITLTYTNLAQWYRHQKQFPLALDYAKKALQSSQELRNINFIYTAALEHSQIAALMGDYQGAYESHVLHKKMADSLQNEKNVRASLQKEFAFKEEQHKLEQQKQELSYSAELQQQKTVRNAVLVALALMGIVAFLAYRSYYMKKKSNLLLEKQKLAIKLSNDELNQVNEELQQQQEELLMLNENLGKQKQELEQTYDQLKITSEQLEQSIAYASSIQAIVLPDLSEFAQYFDHTFVIYKPRDIVSGDFYWLSKIDDQRAVFALADCTGHGVPGAFMSMLGCTLLHEIVNIKQVYDDPARVLRNLNAALQRILKQNSSNNRDGMDISVCYFEKNDITKTIQMIFSGAKTQMYYATSQELVLLHGDKIYLGGRGKQGEFTNKVQTFSEKVQFYFFTDGYIDQNNVEREKFGSIRMKQTLQNICELPVAAQEAYLLQTLAQHQGEVSQRDDISFVYLALSNS